MYEGKNSYTSFSVQDWTGTTSNNIKGDPFLFVRRRCCITFVLKMINTFCKRQNKAWNWTFFLAKYEHYIMISFTTVRNKAKAEHSPETSTKQRKRLNETARFDTMLSFFLHCLKNNHYFSLIFWLAKETINKRLMNRVSFICCHIVTFNLKFKN